MITLDYDDKSYEEVLDDAIDLMKQFDSIVGWEIFESSENHYHTRINHADLSFQEQVKIAVASHCSTEYLKRVAELGYFTIRTTAKSDGTPAPRLRCAMITG